MIGFVSDGDEMQEINAFELKNPCFRIKEIHVCELEIRCFGIRKSMSQNWKINVLQLEINSWNLEDQCFEN